MGLATALQRTCNGFDSAAIYKYQLFQKKNEKRGFFSKKSFQRKDRETQSFFLRTQNTLKKRSFFKQRDMRETAAQFQYFNFNNTAAHPHFTPSTPLEKNIYKKLIYIYIYKYILKKSFRFFCYTLPLPY